MFKQVFAATGIYILVLLTLMKPMRYSYQKDNYHIISNHTVIDCMTGKIIRDLGKPYAVTLKPILYLPDSFEQLIIYLKGLVKKNECQQTEKINQSSTYISSPIADNGVSEVILNRIKKALHKDTLNILVVTCHNSLAIINNLSNRKDISFSTVSQRPSKFLCYKKCINNVYARLLDILRHKAPRSFDLVYLGTFVMYVSISKMMVLLNDISKFENGFLLINDFPTTAKNLIRDEVFLNQSWRHNLSLKPFQFAPPLCIIKEADESWIVLYQLPLKQLIHCSSHIVLIRNALHVNCI